MENNRKIKLPGEEKPKTIVPIISGARTSGKCKRCNEKDYLYVTEWGNYCYDCKRIVLPGFLKAKVPNSGRKIKL